MPLVIKPAKNFEANVLLNDQTDLSAHVKTSQAMFTAKTFITIFKVFRGLIKRVAGIILQKYHLVRNIRCIWKLMH